MLTADTQEVFRSNRHTMTTTHSSYIVTRDFENAHSAAICYTHVRFGRRPFFILVRMGSPIKSLSLREDADGSVCLHKKVKTGIYKSVSDFGFGILYMVKFEGPLNNISGYVFEVNKSLGETQISK